MPDVFALICSELFEMLIFNNSDTSGFGVMFKNEIVDYLIGNIVWSRNFV